jgi:hypothetical protein
MLQRYSQVCALVLLCVLPSTRVMAQTQNPCAVEQSAEPIANPDIFYVESDQINKIDPATNAPIVGAVMLTTVLGINGQEPQHRQRVPVSALTKTAFANCWQGAVLPGPNLVRDGKTVYAIIYSLETPGMLLGPSGAERSPFVLGTTAPPPDPEQLRAPRGRLGRSGAN